MDTIRSIFSSPSKKPRQTPTTSPSKDGTKVPLSTIDGNSVKIPPPLLSPSKLEGYDTLKGKPGRPKKSWDEDSSSSDEESTRTPMIPSNGLSYQTLHSSPFQTPKASPLKLPSFDTIEGRSGSPKKRWTEYDDEDEQPARSQPQTPTHSSKALRGGTVKTFSTSPSKAIHGSPHVTVSGSPNKRMAKDDLWDPDEEEFDRWPEQEQLDKAVRDYKATYGTYKATTRHTPWSTSQYFADSTIKGHAVNLDQSLRHFLEDVTEEDRRDMEEQLDDRKCGDPLGHDLHDDILQHCFGDVYQSLPSQYPARHMHVIDPIFQNSKDSIVSRAHPRLCDGVATVLWNTNPKCLDDFLDPMVKVFEWRILGQKNFLIRRIGNEVLVGIYYNHAFKLFWTCYVKSIVDFTGKWTETYAATISVETPVRETGPAWNETIEEEPSEDLDVKPTDPKYALYIGRKMSRYLLKKQVWDNSRWNGHRSPVEWEADGRITKTVKTNQEGKEPGSDDERVQPEVIMKV